MMSSICLAMTSVSAGVAACASGENATSVPTARAYLKAFHMKGLPGVHLPRWDRGLLRQVALCWNLFLRRGKTAQKAIRRARG